MGRKLVILGAIAAATALLPACGTLTSGFSAGSLSVSLRDHDPPYILAVNSQYFVDVVVRNNLGDEDTSRFYRRINWQSTDSYVADVQLDDTNGWVLITGPVRGQCVVSGRLRDNTSIEDHFTVFVQ